MEGYYLITSDSWFIAPDGQEYRAAWGYVSIVEDKVLGIQTNRQSTNWYARVGDEDTHVIIAGCQIHYAVKCEEPPSNANNVSWSPDGKKFETPCKIYFASQIESIEESDFEKKVNVMLDNIRDEALLAAQETADFTYDNEHYTSLSIDSFVKGCKWLRNKIVEL